MRITVPDNDDFIAPHDPASRWYVPRDPCSYCRGLGLERHDECDGLGWYECDGAWVRCSCGGGRVECCRCDGSGRELR